jgi:hypothetical protein
LKKISNLQSQIVALSTKKEKNDWWFMHNMLKADLPISKKCCFLYNYSKIHNICRCSAGRAESLKSKYKDALSCLNNFET